MGWGRQLNLRKDSGTDVRRLPKGSNVLREQGNRKKKKTGLSGRGQAMTLQWGRRLGASKWDP